MDHHFELVVDGIDFAEGPRWHDHKLWYSDFYQRAIYTVDTDGHRTAVHTDLEDQPSGLGWLPDASLLVVAMTSKRVLREIDGRLVEHADLSSLATGLANDMVVDAAGNAYVGNFGFDLFAGDRFAPADLVLVRADGSVGVAAEALAFPNGMVITPDGSTLIVGQTFGADYVAFDIAPDASLSGRRRWAEVPGAAPDGCTADADGAIWFADALGSQLVRVTEGGALTHRLPTPMGSFACVLGGAAGTTLYALCAPDSNPSVVAGQGNGAIYSTTVDVPCAGRP